MREGGCLTVSGGLGVGGAIRETFILGGRVSTSVGWGGHGSDGKRGKASDWQ